jgi:hypothetical protein
MRSLNPEHSWCWRCRRSGTAMIRAEPLRPETPWWLAPGAARAGRRGHDGYQDERNHRGKELCSVIPTPSKFRSHLAHRLPKICSTGIASSFYREPRVNVDDTASSNSSWKIPTVVGLARSCRSAQASKRRPRSDRIRRLGLLQGLVSRLTYSSGDIPSFGTRISSMKAVPYGVSVFQRSH